MRDKGDRSNPGKPPTELATVSPLLAWPAGRLGPPDVRVPGRVREWQHDHRTACRALVRPPVRSRYRRTDCRRRRTVRAVAVGGTGALLPSATAPTTRRSPAHGSIGDRATSQDSRRRKNRDGPATGEPDAAGPLAAAGVTRAWGAESPVNGIMQSNSGPSVWATDGVRRVVATTIVGAPPSAIGGVGMAPASRAMLSAVTSSAPPAVAPSRIRSAEVVHEPVVIVANGLPNAPPTGARNASRRPFDPVPLRWWIPTR